MVDWFRDALFAGGAEANNLLPWDAILMRLVVASFAGWLVALSYCWGRRSSLTGTTFPGTLVLMTILIAAVTQVIGDNAARAFGLVGALSIVRFRTVMQDTQDVAYVIFAVAVGMAIGAGQPIVGFMCWAGISLAGTIFRHFPSVNITTNVATLHVRLGVGRSPEASLEPALKSVTTRLEMTSVETAKQGAAVDVEYRLLLRPEISPADLVARLNQIEGVQQVQFRKEVDDD